MKKKLLSLFVTCCLVLSFLSLPALESRASEVLMGRIYVGDVEMDSSNGTVYATTDANGTVTIRETYKESDPWNVKYSGNTLVLRNANIYGTTSRSFSGLSSKTGMLLYNEEILKLIPEGDGDKYMENIPAIHLQLEGKNSIATSDVVEEEETYNVGIEAINLEISGNGSLTVTAGKGAMSSGIWSLWDLTINNGEINCSGDNNSQMSVGIYAVSPYAGLVINGGQLTAKGGSVTKGQSCGIVTMKTSISGGSLTAMGEGENSSAFSLISKGPGDDSYMNSVMISPLAGTSIIAKAGNAKENAQPLQSFPFTSKVDITSQLSEAAYFHSYVNITDVIVSPSAVQVQKGQTKQFAATTMSGQVQVDTDVNWSVEGASASDTSISDGGLLTVSAKESAKTLTVRATSDNNPSQSGTAVVTVTEPSNGGTNPSSPSSNSANTTSGQVGTVFNDAATKNTYKVTGNGTTVEYMGNAANKKKTVEIPNTVTINGTKYTVTSVANNAFKNNKKVEKVVIGKTVTKIGKKAFYGCKNLKKITIKSTKLKKKTIGAKAFSKAGSKNYSKLKVIVPKKCLKNYTKIFRQKGLSSKVVIKK